MAYDVYQPCPFCTDKKLKFCCADIAEDMEKVARLGESGQTRAALKILDRLAATRPNTVWNEATRASYLLAEGQGGEAKAILERLHAAQPENLSVIALLGTAALAADGFEAAREHLWRAFRKAAGYADVVSGIALGVAAEMFDAGRYLSARQHLTIAMRLARPRDQQAIFVRLLEFDGDAEIPYPLRSVHSLRDVAGDDERRDAARKAIRLADRGCFGQAAERFAGLAASAPEDTAARYDLALCRAWNGEESAAAQAFDDASRLEPDFEVAAEYAALSQLLLAGAESARVPMKNAEYRVASASKLISDLDGHARFVRITLPPEAAGGQGMPDAVFEVLDRPMPDDPATAETDPASLPNAVGQFAVFGSPEDADGPRAALAGFEGRDFEAARSLLTEAASGLEALDERTEPGDATLPRDLAGLHARLGFPERTTVRARRAVEARRWLAALAGWSEAPQAALGGASPAEAAKDASRRAAVAGAAYVLDAFCLQGRHTLDLDETRTRLGLPPVARIAAQPDLPLNTFSIVQLQRLDVAGLDDKQLAVVLNRSLLVHHGRFLGPALEEALRRGLPDLDPQRLYLTLSDLARDAGDAAAALAWVERGRQQARGGEQAFENVFRWDTKELGLRLEDPSDPEVQPFARRLAAYYGPKVPRFGESLDQLLAVYGVTRSMILETADAGSGGGLWNPNAPASGEKKLWLPGS